jgi:hypothetical protein
MQAAAFEYVEPTEEQHQRMATVRKGAADYAQIILSNVPDGPDRTYMIRKLREVAMWANVAITRNPDGSKRT